MIPAAFDYARAGSLDEALELVAGVDPSVRVLAGGQSLVPLMKLRLGRPRRRVDLGRIAELRGIDEMAGGGLRVGSLTTWATLLADPRITRIGALADALPLIGDVQVRNLGTIGGSLAHADPASDIAAPALALDLEVVVRSAGRGERRIALPTLFAGAFATTIEPDEILTSVLVPETAARAASAYLALPQLASGYPIAGVAIAIAPSGAVAVGVTGVGERPYRAAGVEAAIAAGQPAAEAIEASAANQRVATDIHADREYRGAMANVMARRAFSAAELRRPA